MVRELWRTVGGKLLIGSFVFLSLSMIYFATAIIVEEREDFSPLRNINPQPIDNPVVKRGDPIGVRPTKCNDAVEPIGYDYRTYWRNVETRELIFRNAMDGATREPGCQTGYFPNNIPDDFPLGKWRIEGVETARSDDGRTQVESYYTETFEVVE